MGVQSLGPPQQVQGLSSLQGPLLPVQEREPMPREPIAGQPLSQLVAGGTASPTTTATTAHPAVPRLGSPPAGPPQPTVQVNAPAMSARGPGRPIELVTPPPRARSLTPQQGRMLLGPFPRVRWDY